MKVTKCGHCCLFIEEKGVRVVTDPGSYSTSQNELKNIDAVVITHEHSDHLHVESLKTILKNNPNAGVITNKSVGNILAKAGIAFEVVESGEKMEIVGQEGSISIEGHGTQHAEVYKTIPRVQNTGYLIADKLFYPGDSFHNPQKPVDVLALPVAGPWMKLSEAIDFALAVKPRAAFPVHDAMLNAAGQSMNERMLPTFLDKAGIKFVAMKEASVEEF